MMTSGEASQDQQHSGDQRSGDRVLYPTLSEKEVTATSPGVADYETGRWGTYKLGTPSNPNAHPKNQEAATWEALSNGNLGVPSDEGSPRGEQKAFQQSPPSAPSTGYTVTPPVSSDNPYISTTPAPSYTGKAPGDVIYEYLKKWSKSFEDIAKKAEETASNIWLHLKTGPSVADTAWGRLSQGTKLLAEGGYEKVFRQTFETTPDEKLCKTYACYLSTSSGPVAGTLYISTLKIAFCSDRPLSYSPSTGQTAWSYYKVVLPLNMVQAVNPSANESNPAEKYIQIVTTDTHEFWFMGFVNYDKAVKNLLELLQTFR
eukprot:c19466_g1_i1 orf=325-1272(-)